MNIGAVSKRSGVPAKTIRYYESIGLIRPADRRDNNYRDYSETDIQTLRFISRARGLGFSVKEVGALLTLWHDKRRASQDVKKLATRHIADIDAKIAALEAMRRTLAALSARCHGDNRPDCPILDDLSGEPDRGKKGHHLCH